MTQPESDNNFPIEQADNPRRRRWRLNGRWEIRKRGPESPAYQIQVPGVWDSLPGFKGYVGDCIYRREFNLPAVKGRRYWLHFMGVMHRQRVRINGRELAGPSAGFVPARFEVTEFLEPVNNVIEVLVSNRAVDAEIPDRVCWARDGGIFREVYIEETPRFAALDLRLESETESGLTAVAGSFMLDGLGEADQPRISVRIIDPADEPTARIEVFQAEGSEVTWRTEPAAMALWSPSNPVLHRVEITVEIDGETDGLFETLGVRDLAVEQDGVYINGERIDLYGVVRVEDAPGYGPVQTREIIESDIQLIKSGGFNAVRTGRWPAHPFFLDCCDREGLLVLEEIPAHRCAPWALARKGFRDSALSVLESMILRDRNHPSVIMWGLGSGLPGYSIKAAETVRNFAARARQLDSRPLYAATHLHMSDKVQEDMDVIALSYWPRWLHKHRLPRIGRRWAAKQPGKPLIVVETGAGARKGYDIGVGRLYSEQQQTDILIDGLKRIKRQPEVTGVFIGHLTDFRDEGAFAETPPFENHTGLADYRRQKKPAFDAVRDFWFEGKVEKPDRAAPIMNLPMLSTLGVMAGCLWLLWFIYNTLLLNPGQAKFFFSEVGDILAWDMGKVRTLLIIMLIIAACSLSAGVSNYWRNRPLHIPLPGAGLKRAASAVLRWDLLRIAVMALLVAVFFALEILALTLTRTPINNETLIFLIRPTITWALLILLLFQAPMALIVPATLAAQVVLLGFSPLGWTNAVIVGVTPALILLGVAAFYIQMEIGLANLFKDHTG